MTSKAPRIFVEIVGAEPNPLASGSALEDTTNSVSLIIRSVSSRDVLASQSPCGHLKKLILMSNKLKFGTST